MGRQQASRRAEMAVGWGRERALVEGIVFVALWLSKRKMDELLASTTRKHRGKVMFERRFFKPPFLRPPLLSFSS